MTQESKRPDPEDVAKDRRQTKSGFVPQAMTANRLRDGAVIFLRQDHTWSENLVDVAVANDAEQAATLQAAADRDVAAARVVGAYLFEIAVENGDVLPLRYRERIRAFGPSIPWDRPVSADQLSR